MGYIKKLKNNELVGGTDKTTIYPVTSTEAVFEEITEGSESNFKSQKFLNNNITGDRINEGTITDYNIATGTITKGKLTPQVQTMLDEGQKKALTPKGNYNSETEYEALDLVFDPVTNSSYISLVTPNVGHPVDENAEGYEEGWWEKTLDGTAVNTAQAAIDAKVGQLETQVGTAITQAETAVDEAKQETLNAYTQAEALAQQITDWSSSEISSIPSYTDQHPLSNRASSAQVGYFECGTSSATQASNQIKAVTAGGYALPTSGGAVKIKMYAANTYTPTTNNPVKLQFNADATTLKELRYNNEAVSPNNTWDAGDVISVYYDGSVYQASNAQGGSNRKINTYLYGGLRILAVGQSYKNKEAVTTPDKQLLKVTKDVKVMTLTDEVAIGDLKINGNNTYQAQKAISSYNGSTTYTDGDYAIGRPATASIAFSVNAETISALEEAVDITVTIVGKICTASVDSTSNAASVATDIYNSFGTVEGWSLANDDNGTLTLKSLSAVTTAPNVTSSVGESGVTVTPTTVAGSTTLSQYNSGAWSTVTLSNYAADAVAVGETDATKMWKTLDYLGLLTYTEQNYAPVLYNNLGDNIIGAINQKVASETFGVGDKISFSANSTYVAYWIASSDNKWAAYSNTYPYWGRIMNVERNSQYLVVASDSGAACVSLLRNNTPVAGNVATDWPLKWLSAGESAVINTEDYDYLFCRGASSLYLYPKELRKIVPTREKIDNMDGEFAILKDSEVYEVDTLFTPLFRLIIDNCGTDKTNILGVEIPADTYDVVIDTPETDGAVLQELSFYQGTVWRSSVTNISLDGNTHIIKGKALPTAITRFYEDYAVSGSYGKLTIYLGKRWGTVSTAIKQIPNEKRKVGLIIKFLNPRGEIAMYKHIGTDMTDYENVSKWKNLYSDNDDTLTIPMSKYLPKGSIGIMADPSENSFGEEVSLGAAIKSYCFLPCEGYNYVDTRLWPASGDGYKYGLVFYDEDYEPIEGYGSMSIVAASTNMNNPYWYPVHLEIPSNAVWFRMSYRSTNTPVVALTRGTNRVYNSWDKYTYKGERIQLTPTNNVYLSRYMVFDDGLEGSHQGACVWGNYLFVFNQSGQFSVIDMMDSIGGGAKINPIQSAISAPGMSGAHNDTPCFTNKYYASGDEFPLLLCGGGTSNSQTYFYVLRIVRTESGGVSTFTSTLVQTITVLGNGFMTPYYHTDRGLIVSSNGAKTVLTNKTVSGTAGDYTLDLTNQSNIVQEFPYDVHSGSVYNNNCLFGVYDNGGSPLFCSLNLYTGKYTTFSIPRWNEPEGVVMWNNELYIYYLGWLGKVYFE